MPPGTLPVLLRSRAVLPYRAARKHLGVSGVNEIAFVTIVQTRPSPPLADRFISGFPIDYGPALLRRPFGFPSRWTPCPPKYSKGKVESRGSGFSLPVALAGLSLRRLIPVWHGSVSCYNLFHFLRPARNYPRFWIWRPSFERQRDLNPPEQRAAQHALRASPPPQTAWPVSRELPVDPLTATTAWGFPCCVWSPMPTCRRPYPGRFSGARSLVLLHCQRPSLV